MFDTRGSERRHVTQRTRRTLCQSTRSVELEKKKKKTYSNERKIWINVQNDDEVSNDMLCEVRLRTSLSKSFFTAFWSPVEVKLTLSMSCASAREEWAQMHVKFWTTRLPGSSPESIGTYVAHPSYRRSQVLWESTNDPGVDLYLQS